jgi:hypothetical protein
MMNIGDTKLTKVLTTENQLFEEPLRYSREADRHSQSAHYFRASKADGATSEQLSSTTGHRVRTSSATKRTTWSSE